MIVCHCNSITKADIKKAVYTLLMKTLARYSARHRFYHALESQCCGCYLLVIEEITSLVVGYHTQKGIPSAKITSSSNK